MTTTFEDQIRERAYHIWLAAGMADGQADVHWVSAEQAVLGEKTASAEAEEPIIIITKAASKPARKAAAEKPAKKTGAKIAREKPSPKSKAKTAAH